MKRETFVDDSFNDFRDEVEVGDGSIAGKVVRREIMLFEKRVDKGMLERFWEVAFGEGKIDDGGDGDE